MCLAVFAAVRVGTLRFAQLRCFGAGAGGRLGGGSATSVFDSALAVRVDIPGVVVEASAGAEHSCALSAELEVLVLSRCMAALSTLLLATSLIPLSAMVLRRCALRESRVRELSRKRGGQRGR